MKEPSPSKKNEFYCAASTGALEDRYDSFGRSVWRFPSDSISTMLREARKDENVRGSAERKGEGSSGGVLEIESSPLPLYWKIPGSRCRLVEDSACTGEMQNDRQRPRDQLLLAIRCSGKSTMNVGLRHGYSRQNEMLVPG